MDESEGIAWTKWCLGGKTNIVLNCIDRHKKKSLFKDTFIFAIKVKINPDGAKLLAIITKFLFLKIKTKTDKKAIHENIPNDIHAEGT